MQAYDAWLPPTSLLALGTLKALGRCRLAAGDGSAALSCLGRAVCITDAVYSSRTSAGGERTAGRAEAKLALEALAARPGGLALSAVGSCCPAHGAEGCRAMLRRLHDCSWDGLLQELRVHFGEVGAAQVLDHLRGLL